MLDADVILFATEKPSDIPALEKVPTFGRLKAVAEHRAVFTDGVLTGAIYFISPLSLPYVLDRLRHSSRPPSPARHRRIETAVRGSDPLTPAPR